jgi:hypothetical protein
MASDSFHDRIDSRGSLISIFCVVEHTDGDPACQGDFAVKSEATGLSVVALAICSHDTASSPVDKAARRL